MQVSPKLGTASPTEKERKWFISGEHETAISGVIHVTKSSNGKWEYDVYGESIGVFLSRDWLRRSREGFKSNNLTGDVSISVIRAISRLVPIPPIHLDNVCSTNKNLFIKPNYDPDFNFPLPQVKYR